MKDGLRIMLRDRGYSPLPLFGKAPAPEKWQTYEEVSSEQIKIWNVMWPRAGNTGILTRKVPAFDIDIINPEAAEAVEEMVRAYYEDTEKGRLLMRIGLPPKRAFLFRTDSPFKKLQVLFEGTSEKLEFLCDGQQVVVDGIHPDTQKPYTWFGGNIEAVKRTDLPCIDAEEAQGLLWRAADILKGYGYKRIEARPRAVAGGNGEGGQARGQTGGQDWGWLVDRIKAGETLHDSLRDLAAKLITSGMSGGAATNFLRSQMGGLVKDERWQERYDDIPRLVRGAEDKFGKPAPVADVSELLAKAPALSATPYVCIDPSTIPLREWLYGFLLIRKFVSLTAAPGGIGKSSLLTAEALAQVTGRNLLEADGVGIPRPLRVWLWNLEDPAEEITRKVEATRLHYGLAAEEINGRLFINSGRDQPLVIAKTVRGETIVEPIVDRLIARIKELSIDVLVIDPFVSCNQVPENDNNGQDLVVKQWAKVAELANCAVHLVDHTRKAPEGTEVTAGSTRGASSKVDACRVVRAINQMTEKQAEAAGLAVNAHKLYFRTFNDKANLAPPAERSEWFKLESVRLGNGTNIAFQGIDIGDGGDSVGVVTPWKWPNLMDGVTGADFDRAAAVIDSGKWRKDSQCNEEWVGEAIAQGLGLRRDKSVDLAKIKMLLKTWLESGSLEVYDDMTSQRKPGKFIRVAVQ